MTFSDILRLAWRTIRSNKLRTGITVSIIAFGIMALIGIITAIEAMNQSLKESFFPKSCDWYSTTALVQSAMAASTWTTSTIED